MQADLVNAILGALVCLTLTFGNGFNLITAGFSALWGTGIISQFFIVFTVSLILTVIDIPVAWWKQFRINERYGYEKTERGLWFKRLITDIATGLAVEMPAYFHCSCVFKRAFLCLVVCRGRGDGRVVCLAHLY